MTPYCPTPQHLLHMQEGFNLLRLMTFSESQCPGYLNFLWNFSQTHYSDVRWCTSKWTLDNRLKKRGGGGITPRLPFHFIFLQQQQFNKCSAWFTWCFCILYVVIAFSLKQVIDLLHIILNKDHVFLDIMGFHIYIIKM